MKKTIRKGCFETNSSTTHCIVIDTEERIKMWENGELILDNCNDTLVPINEAPENHNSYDYQTYNEFGGDFYHVDEGKFTTPSGDKMQWVAYYGVDY